MSLPRGASGSGRYHASAGVEKHLVSSVSAGGSRSAGGVGCRAEQRREGAGERCSAGQTGERESGPERQRMRGWQCRTGRGWGVASGWVGEQGALACAGGARAAVRRGGGACRAHRKRVSRPCLRSSYGPMRRVQARNTGSRVHRVRCGTRRVPWERTRRERRGEEGVVATG